MTEQLRQSENTIYVEGIVVENTLQVKEKNGNEYIVGYIDIETEEDNKHRLTAFANKYKKDEKDRSKFSKEVSGLFTGLSTVKDGYQVGDKVRVNRGQFGSNDYFSNGEVRSYPQLSTNFFNRLKDSDEFKPQAKFTLEVFIKNIKEEVERTSQEPTGRAIVEGYVVTFGGKVAPFTGVVDAGKNSEYVLSNFEAGETVVFSGDIKNISKTNKIEIEVDFGEPQVEYKTETMREYIIKSGRVHEKEEKNFDPKDIKKAVQERAEYLEEIKNKNNSNNIPEGFDGDKKGNTFEDEKKPKKNKDFDW